MSRLPSPGGDDGQWGSILNDYLAQAHTPSGDLKSGIVTVTHLADGSVTAPKLATNATPTNGQVLSYSAGMLAWAAPSGGASAVTSVNSQVGDVILSKADVGLGNVDNTSDVLKPLSDATVNALATKADDSATVHLTGNQTITGVKNFTGTLQAGGQAVIVTNDARLSDSRTPINGSVSEAKLSAGPGTNGQVLASNGSGGLLWTTNTPGGSIGDADASTKGIVQLAGDLAGTAGSPQVAKVKGVTLPVNAPSTGQVLTATSSTAASWSTPSAGGVTSVAGRTGAVVIDETDVTNLTADLAAKAPLASPTFTGTVITPAIRVSGGTPGTGKVLTSDATGVATWQAAPAASDATTIAKGIVQLAGDLAGTAASPQVAKVKGVAVTGVPSAGQTLVATSSTAAAWSAVSSASNATSSAPGLIQLAGDLGGTATSPTVVGLSAKAADSAVVHNSGAETVAGIKTFSSSPVIPTPTNGTDASTKAYVDSAISSATIADATTTTKGKIQLAGDLAGTAALPTVPGLAAKAADSTVVHNSGNETVAGVKTFSSSPVVPLTPTTTTQTASKGYVDTAIAGVSSGGNGNRAVTAVKTSAYTANVGEYVLVNATAGGFTVTMPASPTNGAWVSVKKVEGTSNAVLVVPNSGATIEDAGNMSGVSVSLNFAYGDVDFIYGGNVWYRVG